MVDEYRGVARLSDNKRRKRDVDNKETLEAIRGSLNVLVLIAVFVICYFAKELLFPIVLGVLIALTLSPVCRGLARIGIPHAVTAVMLIGALAVAIAAAIYVSAGQVATWGDDFRAAGEEIQDKISGVTEQVDKVREAASGVEEMTAATEEATDAPEKVVVDQPTLLDSALSTAGSVGATLAVALVLAVFLLASGDLFYIKLVQSFKRMKEKKRALNMVYDIERRVSRYLLTITIINAGLGLAIGLAMWGLGMPYPYIIGIAGFLLNFLPYLGAVVGALLTAAYAAVTFDTAGAIIAPPLIYYALTSIEGQFITPTAVGRSLELNTVAVFVTVVLWGWLWGIAGALIAVPFLVVVKVIADNVDRLQVLANFLGGADVPLRPDAEIDKTEEEKTAAQAS